MAITLVRHTQPDIAEGICYGRLDLSLADTFDTEAQAVLQKLKPADVLVSSPLNRCKRLADKIGEHFEQPVIIDERLREMDFGDWEGLKWEDILRQELDSWRDNFYEARPHGGESVKMLTDRVLSAISDYRKTGKRHIVVCHAGVIKAATSQGKSAEDFETSVPFGGLIQLE